MSSCSQSPRSERVTPHLSPDTAVKSDTSSDYIKDLHRNAYDEILASMNENSNECFLELNAFMSNKPQLDARFDQLIHEACLASPDGKVYEPLYSPGPAGNEQPISQLYAELKETARQTRMAAALCPADNTPAPADSINILWKNWMMVAEILFVQVTKYAKRLPGFEQLYLDDKVILLKSARIEIMTIMA